jgi:predicted DNA-binding ribbon-helix-helix protein
MVRTPQPNGMKSAVIKRSIVIDGHKTSISMEDMFWTSFKEIAKENAATLSQLAASIDEARGPGANLSSAIRVYILDRVQTKARAQPRAGEVPDQVAGPARAA